MTDESRSCEEPPVVTLRGLGDLQGERCPWSTEVIRFLDVPYGAPPVGDARWRAPKTPEPWDGLRTNPRTLTRCPQPRRRQRAPPATFEGYTLEDSEDCLKLAIWTPLSALHAAAEAQMEAEEAAQLAALESSKQDEALEQGTADDGTDDAEGIARQLAAALHLDQQVGDGERAGGREGMGPPDENRFARRLVRRQQSRRTNHTGRRMNSNRDVDAAAQIRKGPPAPQSRDLDAALREKSGGTIVEGSEGPSDVVTTTRAHDSANAASRPANAKPGQPTAAGNPAISTAKHLLPVIVYIHGGGGTQGSCHTPNHSGEALSRTQNIVFISLNYRLGILGWLAHPALSEEDKQTEGEGCSGARPTHDPHTETNATFASARI